MQLFFKRAVIVPTQTLIEGWNFEKTHLLQFSIDHIIANTLLYCHPTGPQFMISPALNSTPGFTPVWFYDHDATCIMYHVYIIWSTTFAMRCYSTMYHCLFSCSTPPSPPSTSSWAVTDTLSPAGSPGSSISSPVIWKKSPSATRRDLDIQSKNQQPI